MYGQMGAVTGLRKRPSYTDIINTEASYLPRQQQAKQDREFQDKTFEFNEQQAQWDKDQAEKQRILDDEAAHDARKQQNRESNLGYANLSLSAADLLGDILGWF